MIGIDIVSTGKLVQRIPNVLEKIANFPKYDFPSSWTGSVVSDPSSAMARPHVVRDLNMDGSISPINAAELAGAAAATQAERSIGGTILSGDDMSLSTSEIDIIRVQGLYLWLNEGFQNYFDGFDDDKGASYNSPIGHANNSFNYQEDVIIENMWRCFSLIDQGLLKIEAVVSPPYNTSGKNMTCD